MITCSLGLVVFKTLNFRGQSNLQRKMLTFSKKIPRNNEKLYWIIARIWIVKYCCDFASSLQYVMAMFTTRKLKTGLSGFELSWEVRCTFHANNILFVRNFSKYQTNEKWLEKDLKTDKNRFSTSNTKNNDMHSLRWLLRNGSSSTLREISLRAVTSLREIEVVIFEWISKWELSRLQKVSVNW